MKKFLMAVAVLACLGNVALAAENAGGTIFVHDANIAYTSDTASYCGLGTAPASCEAADVQMDLDTPDMVWKVYAAFPAQSNPRLKAIEFGITYAQDSAVAINAWGPCPEFELPMDTWPASGSGNALVWDNTQLDRLVEVYWFAGYGYGAPSTFALIPHPEQGGFFANDATPSELDPIAAYGTLGFGQPGETACPGVVQPTGACCDAETGECTITFEADCPQGQWQGPDTTCNPNPCPQPLGACCVPDTGECTITFQADCIAPNNWIPGYESCDPNPCPVTATQETSWGSIKNIYR